MPDHPAREHAAPRASADIHARRVHVAAPDHRVHPGHEVVVVGSRIVVVDAARERVAVAGRAARVGVQHHVAVRREVLEPDVVHRERAAVDLEDQRIALRRIERRRLDDPALYPRPAARRVPHLFDPGQPLVRQHVVVHRGDARRRGSLPAPQIDPHDVGGVVRIAAYADTHGGARQRGERDHLRPLRDVADAAREIGVADVDRAAIGSGEVDAPTVRRPAQIVRIAVQRAGEIAQPRAVEPHRPEVRRTVRLVRGVGSGQRDGAPVRGHHWSGPVPGP